METAIDSLARKAQIILMQGVCKMQWAYQNVWNAMPKIRTRLPLIGGTVKTTTKTSRNKKTRITIETERVWLIENADSAKDWCEACGKMVTSVSPEVVASLASGAHGPNFAAKLDSLHFIGTYEGLMRVCVDSLLKQMSGKA
jgi:hypothetical protein